MATAELVIAFDARADKLEASLKRVTTQLNQLETVVGRTGGEVERNTGLMARAFDRATTNLTRFAVAYAGLRGVEAFARLAVSVDDLSQSLLRLQVLTGSSVGEAASQFSRLAAIASGAGQPIGEVANQFTRFFTATASLGASRQEVEQFVKVLTDFGRLSTGGPQEVGAAITQLSQGLASGKLQGDELKSILENMPVLASALARELGVSVGELRKMGEEGRLTAENVFPAILRAGADLTRMLEGVPLSLRQSFQAFANSGLSAVARLDSAIGATEFLARIFRGVSSGVDNVTRRSYGTGPDAPVAIRAQNLREEIATAAGELNRAEAQLRVFEQRRAAIAERFAGDPNAEARIRSVLGSQNINQEAALRRDRDAINERFDARRAALRTVEEQEREENRLAALERERTGRDQRIGEADTVARTITEQTDKIAKATRERDDRLRALQTTLNDRRARDAERGVGTAATDAFERQQRAAIAAIFEREKAEATAGARADAAAAQRQREREAREIRERELREARERRSALEVIRGTDRGTTRDIDNLFERLTTPAVGSTVGSPIQVALQQGIQLQEIFGAIETQVTATGTAVQRSGGNMADVLASAKRNAELLRDALIAESPGQEGLIRERTQEAIARMETSLARVARAAKDTWNAIGVQGVTAFANDLSGALIDFVTTGEQKFDEMAANFLKNIAKMILQMQILNALKAGLGPGGLGLLTFANGGAAPADRPYIIGERGPELFVPTGSGYIVPNHQLGGGGGSTTVNVYNQASGTTTRQQERTNGLGGKEIDIYIEQIVQRGITNGRFDAAMGQSFGASRAGRV